MEHPIMEPPFEIRPFNKMSNNDAERHFLWYIGEIDKRVEILKAAYEQTNGIEKNQLDFSPESLINLWSWFMERVEVAPKKLQELEEEKKDKPEWLQLELEKNTNKLTIETLVIAMDIAIYFGEVFRKEFSKLDWAYVTKPKSLNYVNRPVIKGFRKIDALDPRNIVYNLTLDVAEDVDKNKNSLYELYNVWSEYI